MRLWWVTLLILGCGGGARPVPAGVEVDASAGTDLDASAGLNADVGLDATPGTGLDGDADLDATPGTGLDGDADLDATPDAGPDGGAEPDASAEPDAGGAVAAPLVFDMAMIADPATANCDFSAPAVITRGLVPLQTWALSYTSWESIDGELVPITIRGFAARPATQDAGDALPGVVTAHGLGGFAKPNDAASLAARLGMFVIAYTGPGGGDSPSNSSEGFGASYMGGYRLFDTLADPRGSWFWGHAVAAMRAVTCLETRPEVDPSRLGMTGFSAGGVVTLISAAVDARLKAAVPLSGTGGWALAVKSPAAWQHGLLSGAGLTDQSPEWATLLEHIDSTNLLPSGTTPVLMVNGTTDEFFPLSAHNATFDAINVANAAVTRRTSLAANFDHGCYALTGVEPAATIAARAELRANGAQILWFSHYFGTDPRFATLPAMPTVATTAVGLATAITAQVDPGGTQLQVEHVTAWWSNDNAYIWGSVALDPISPSLWGHLGLFPTQPNTALFVDVQYRTKGVLPDRFSLSSRPSLPPGFVPHIRASDTCL